MERCTSVGPLRYTDAEYKLNVEVDPEIVRLARSFVPKTVKLNRTRFAPHITVVRNEIPKNISGWRSLEGVFVGFEYDPCVLNDDTYYWLRVWSPTLTKIRIELGLPASSEWTRAPDGFESYHLTIGNLKV